MSLAGERTINADGIPDLIFQYTGSAPGQFPGAAIEDGA